MPNANPKITIDVDVRGLEQLMHGKDVERRVLVVEDLRVEQRDGEAARIVGHAAVFNSLSEDLGGFREMIAPGAFAEAVGRDDVRALFNHDSNIVLGRTKAGTLKLSEDERGLLSEIFLPDTTQARDLAVSMKRGDVTQMSFAFSVRKEDQDWKRNGDGPWERTIRKVARLYDVSPVTYPAYPQTDAAVRCMNEFIEAAAQEARRGLTTQTEGVVLIQRQRARMLEAGL